MSAVSHPGRAELLLERDGELESLRAALAEAANGEGRLALVEGPAGIGKTRLLAELRAAAEEDGARVLSARGSELEREFPFGVYHGHEGVREWFDNVFGVFPDWQPRPRPASHDEDGAVVIGLDVTATGAGSGVPIDQVYWLGAQVRDAKIVFFGFFRTESDALEAVT